MNKNIALIAAGTVFGLVAILHLVRVFLHIEIVAMEYVIPQWVSIVGCIVAGVLSIWMFLASRNIPIKKSTSRKK